MTPAKPLRQAMPRVAEFVDAVRVAFGAAAVDRATEPAPGPLKNLPIREFL
jgi:hypothetical protein